MGFIEIKSAAQWKAMSDRISWKFDEEEEQPKSQKKERQFNFTFSTNHEGLDGFKPTKVQQLRLVCWKVKPWKQPKNNKLFSSQFAMAWGVDCDEVYPSLFVGDKESATNVQFLQKIGITHVLNTAEGKDEGLVDLCEAHYEGSNIKYLGFPLWDTPMCNITPYLGCAADYINNCIENGGKCLVNCQMGVSRSSSCAMAYLLIHKEMTAVEVLKQFRQHRDVRPNDGFLERLVELDNELRKEREHGQQRAIHFASKEDARLLPQPWNYEFWTSAVTEEDIGHPLVKLGEPCPIPVTGNSSKMPSRGLSRRSSRKSLNSRRSSKSSRSISRRSSFRNSSICTEGVEENANGEEWEWVWEDEEENEENVDPMMNSVTQEKLEQVKDIIEKPEEKWRHLWQSARNCDTPSSVASSSRSCHSNRSTSSKLSNNLIQAGVEGNDPLSLINVVSAKQWKAISQKLTINLDGIDLNDEPQMTKDPLPRPDTPTDFTPTTVKQLRLVCWRVKPWDQPRARHLFSSVLASGWGVDCDEVFPNIFIGDEASARNIRFLQKMGITHVLNAAEGIWTDCSFVDLTADYYNGSGINYLGLQLWDSTKVRILPFLGCANEFIAAALAGGGKCLVHCQMGVSRSCTSAMAYMMLTEGWDAVEVMREFRKRRDVRPNDHFLNQVVELDNALRKQRLFNIPLDVKLYEIADLHKLPRPWHHEFWDFDPDPDTLPFKLVHMGDPGSDKPDYREINSEMEGCEEEKISTEEEPILACDVVRRDLAPEVKANRQSAASIGTTSSGDWEWEYYDDDDDEEGDEEDVKELCDEEKETVIDTSKAVGSAREWKDLSSRISSGELVLQEDDEEDVSQPTKPLVPTKDLSMFVPTMEKHLRLVCWKVKPWKEKKTTKMFSSQFAVLWNVDCDEVHPNLFIGDEAAAKNIRFLNHLGITNVLNTAEGRDDNLVDLDENYYEGSGIQYKGFLMWDSTWFDVGPFIEEAVDFIAKALETDGRCLVNCQMGVSRSSTCALAYMMKKKDMTAVEALRQFRTHRDVRPNDGFMKYLVELDNKLRKVREGFLI